MIQVVTSSVLTSSKHVTHRLYVKKSMAQKVALNIDISISGSIRSIVNSTEDRIAQI